MEHRHIPEPGDAGELLPCRAMAERLGVPEAWLRREAAAGRIPGLDAGGRWLFVESLVVRALRERAMGEPPRAGG